jgi:4-hydroxy-2-oxoglutarate aldolase
LARKELSISGVYPPIATAFDKDGEVDLAAHRRNVAAWSKTPLSGVAVLGSNGEYVSLTEREKLEVVAATAEALSEDKELIAGTGCESTKCTINLTRKMAELGAQGALIITPHYYRPSMTEQALVHHYLTIAESSPIPILVYNMPAFSGVDITADSIMKLAEHPNIAGMKDSTGNMVKMGEIIRFANPKFRSLAGSASFLYPAMVLGATGTIAALANVAPYEVCQLYDAVKAGKHDEARELQLRLIRPNAAVTSKFGVPGLKAAMDLRGLYGGPSRLPLLPLSGDNREKIRQIYAEAGLLATTLA